MRTRRLSSKLLKQGYLVERLKSSFRKFYGRYGDLIQEYEVSLSRMLTDTAMLISELTRFDCFYIFSTELLVFIVCRQTDKVFRMPWPSFVRVEIYYKYRLSINRKYRLPESWIFHSEVVRALAFRPRGHEFESRTIPFFPYQGLFFISLFFLFFSISK